MEKGSQFNEENILIYLINEKVLALHKLPIIHAGCSFSLTILPESLLSYQFQKRMHDVAKKRHQ